MILHEENSECEPKAERRLIQNVAMARSATRQQLYQDRTTSERGLAVETEELRRGDPNTASGVWGLGIIQVCVNPGAAVRGRLSRSLHLVSKIACKSTGAAFPADTLAALLLFCPDILRVAGFVHYIFTSFVLVPFAPEFAVSSQGTVRTHHDSSSSSSAVSQGGEAARRAAEA